MKIISLFGAKHGVGTSTTAALLYAGHPDKALLIAHDAGDVRMLLGMFRPEDEDVANIDSDKFVPQWDQRVLSFDNTRTPRQSHLRTALFSTNAEFIIMDWGTTFPTVGTPVCMLDNSYLTLYRTKRMPPEQEASIWKFVCLLDRTRALTSHDVEAVAGPDVIFLDRDSSVMRSSDAGLLALRSPQHTTKPIHKLLEDTPTCSFSSTR